MSAIPIIAAAALCLMAAIALLLGARAAQRREKVMRRFSLGAVLPPGTARKKTARGNQSAALSQWLGWWRKVSAGRVAGPLLVVLAAGVAGMYFRGVFDTLAALLTVVALWWFWRARRRERFKQHIVAQIPLFVDQMIRSLSTGQSVEAAVRLVAKNTTAPLGEILARVIKMTDLGAGLAESLISESEAAQVKALQIVALGIRMGNKFGSSPKEMLQSVMQMIRAEEMTRRELQAMTGETKITALILLLVPLLILLYILVMNPGYLEMMTSDSRGIILFRVAIGMQIFGALLFWRMMKSI